MSKYGRIGKYLIWESIDVKLLGVAIDIDLKLDKNVLKLCAAKPAKN